MYKSIPLEVKKAVARLMADGHSKRKIYDDYYTKQVDDPVSYESFRHSANNWFKKYPDDSTLEAGTYEGFIAHDATVQVSASGDIIQAWIKQKAGQVDPKEFIQAIKGHVEPYEYTPANLKKPYRMLEIPLFDMHWGVAYMDYYEPVLNDILELIESREWDRIVIPFGQDFFHNDSIANGQTTKGTPIEKVDMQKAVKDGKKFIYAIIDAAIRKAKVVNVVYSPGNHDRSISWMFMQVLLERYGDRIVDDSLEYRKVVAYGKNSIMITHGDSKKATPHNLAHIFPITFPEEFSNANVREVHAGHLHHEGEADIYGVMVRRLSTGSKVDEWSNSQDFVGAHRRFMVFEWDLERLRSIHYI